MIARRPLPSRAAVEQARALLAEVAARDPSGELGRGLRRFGSWRSLAAIVGTDWLPLPRRPSAASARVVRQRLRALAGELPTAGEGQAGEAIHVRGTCAPAPGVAGVGDLWRAEVVEDQAGGWAIDEGQDFVLEHGDGRQTLVLAEGGRLVNAARLRPGEQVIVFGLADQVPDRAGVASAASGRGGLLAALRSGPRHPLLVSVIRRYDQSDDDFQD